jgi:vitamin B12 transporter
MARAGGTQGMLWMKYAMTVALAAVLTMPCVARAQDISTSDTIVVTATRTEIPIDDATVPVSVISREDIELSLATDLSELLRFEAGIDIGRNGGPGQATSIFLRGTESNHTLVLVDGVRINPSTIGGAAIQNIAPEIIERVEIVKGARSALYGTDAIGGVINIITRRPDERYIEASTGGGSFASRSGHFSAGERGASSEFGINLNWQSTDGYAPRTDSDIERGYENSSLNLHGAHRFGANEISVRHWQSDGSVEYLDFFLSPVDQDFSNVVTSVGLDTRIDDKRSSKLLLSVMRDQVRQIQSPDFVLSKRASLDWQYSHAFTDHKLTAGLYAVMEDASSLSFGSRFDEQTDVRAVFVQDQLTLGQHRAFVALRLTDHEGFGRHVTWNAEYAYEFNDAWTVNAGLGHAFRAPDASDRFGFGGNLALEPELADEVQVGLRFIPNERHRLDLEFYSNDIEDLIEFDFATFALQNIDRAEIRGAQLGYEYHGEHFVVRADILRQTADNVVSGARLLRRAEKSATLSYTHLFDTVRVGIAVLASGDREDFGGILLPGYVLTNLSGQLQLGERWQLNARVENVFDTRYQTAADYRMQERSGFLELKYHWQ